MSISAGDLGRIVRTIWSTQLGLELEDCALGVLERRLESEESIDVCVQFSGDFSGTLTQRCSYGASIMAASCAFASDNADLSTSEVRDVVEEIAHVTAGNLKSILPGNSKLSFSTTVDSHKGAGTLVAEAGFELQGEPLIVRLMSQEG